MSPGSSPRGWGTRWGPCRDIDAARFIPTWVGNSCGGTFPRCFITVHPHVGGELPLRLCKSIRSNGSSPRGWGTLPARPPVQSRIRFIPTWVGNSQCHISSQFLVAVHPHVGGELVWTARTISLETGSSPRGWGTHYGDCCHIHTFRFIPTWVGNSHQLFRLP